MGHGAQEAEREGEGCGRGQVGWQQLRLRSANAYTSVAPVLFADGAEAARRAADAPLTEKGGRVVFS